jgi:hypothetical protein
MSGFKSFSQNTTNNTNIIKAQMNKHSSATPPTETQPSQISALIYYNINYFYQFDLFSYLRNYSHSFQKIDMTSLSDMRGFFNCFFHLTST